MPSQIAKSLFDKNIKSAKDCLTLYYAIENLKPQDVNAKWLLRAAIVFTVSALDAYFHDKIRYSVEEKQMGTLVQREIKRDIKLDMG